MDASVVGRAVAAAVAVATEEGLRVADAIPIGTGSNVIVHLRPSPIVARVMCGTVVLHPDPHAWLTREIDVGAFLAERTTPVVAPTKEIDPGPYVSGNQWMSFWEHVEVRKAPFEALEIGRALRDLHDALAEYRRPLPPRSAVLHEIDWLLNALAGGDGVSELSAERDRLAEVILEHDHATDQQPLHGDASLSNLLATSSGPRWNDLEDVCVGTVEWDVAGVLSDARAAHGDAFSADVLAAYGGDCDPAALEQVDQVHALYGGLWRRYQARLSRSTWTALPLKGARDGPMATLVSTLISLGRLGLGLGREAVDLPPHGCLPDPPSHPQDGDMDTTTPKKRTMSEVLTRVIAHSRAGLIGLVAVVVLCLCAVAPAVSSAASANPTTTYGTASISWSVASKKVSGTVSDLSADGYCVRAYTRGRNWALGWANAKYIGQACGKGTSTYISDSASLYGDQLNFMLCRGFGSCVAWRLWPAV